MSSTDTELANENARVAELTSLALQLALDCHADINPHEDDLSYPKGRRDAYLVMAAAIAGPDDS